MKKLTLFSLVSMIALCVLCASTATAQRSKKKSKAPVSKTPAKTVASNPSTGEKKAPASSAVAPESKPTAEEKPAAASKATNAEPTEEEMKQAIINSAVNQGGEKTSGGAVAMNNAISGASMNIDDFEKIGCAPANYGVGYICTYNIRASLSFHSNQGTAAGDRHAQAVNTLARLLGGGRPKTTTTTSRFVRTKNGWLVTKD